jgi:hypothetical protein
MDVAYAEPEGAESATRAAVKAVRTQPDSRSINVLTRLCSAMPVVPGRSEHHKEPKVACLSKPDQMRSQDALLILPFLARALQDLDKTAREEETRPNLCRLVRLFL